MTNSRRTVKSVATGDSRPARRNQAKPTEERLQKVLAAAGIASRRECESLILEGRVEVDGDVVTELGTKVNRGKQDIRVDGEPLPQTKFITVAVNKPTGYVCTSKDPQMRPRVIDLVPDSVGRVYTIGRLDSSSEGLILVTNDGDLANLLTHPKHGIEKTYHVTVAGRADREVVEKLCKGVHLAEGFAKATAAKVRRRSRQSTVLEIVLAEGRNREIRRLLAKLGHKVVRLVRVAIGPYRLGELPEGSYHILSGQDVSMLRNSGQSRGKKAANKRNAKRTTRQSGYKSKTRRS